MTDNCINLKFAVSKIEDDDGLSISLAVPSSMLFTESEKDLSHHGTVNTSLDFMVAGAEIILQGSVAGAWTVLCSRCLKSHASPYESDFDETYPLSSKDIDVTELLRENALLEFPQRSLCSPDCKIPYGEDGVELGQPKQQPNASPFAALKKLKEK